MKDVKTPVDFSQVKPNSSQKENMAIQLRENEDEIVRVKQKIFGLSILSIIPLSIIFIYSSKYDFSNLGYANSFNMILNIAWILLIIFLVDCKIREYQARMSENRILRTFLGD